MNTNVQLKLNSQVYRDKVYACWIGKNIGGTMGGPFEGKKEILNVQGFTTAPGEVLPNDDLDLQLVWLHAVESIGARAVDCKTLGEFWLSLIPPHWNEYGIGKTNMRMGLIPPLSGDYRNVWKHSNGAWIRTEVWASMAPGCPALAAKYAIEDAKVDHGSGEGTYAAAFVAAMQSAAFVRNDLRACIELGLKAIPTNCRIADSVRLVMENYDKGTSAMDTRNLVLERNMDIGDGWFEAPSNVAYTVLGLLYGEGDFKKSMILAINCGDDTDCTAATVGATLGILGGSASIPEDWSAYIGDAIITRSINESYLGYYRIPKTCTELTDRVMTQAPHMLFENDAPVALTDGASVFPEDLDAFLDEQCKSIINMCVVTPYSMHFEGGVFHVDVALSREPEIAPMGEIEVDVKLTNNIYVYDRAFYNVHPRWWLPEGFTVEGGMGTLFLPNKDRRHAGTCHYHVTIRAGEQVGVTNRCVLELTIEGRSLPVYIPINLLG